GGGCSMSSLCLVERDRWRARTRLNGAVVGWKNSILCDSPFSATVKSSFFKLGRAIPERFVTETWRLTSAALRTIASSSALLAFVSGAAEVSAIGGSLPTRRVYTCGAAFRVPCDGVVLSILSH